MGFQESGLSLAKALVLGAKAPAAETHIAPTIANESNAAAAGMARMVFLTHTTFRHRRRLQAVRAAGTKGMMHVDPAPGGPFEHRIGRQAWRLDREIRRLVVSSHSVAQLPSLLGLYICTMPGGIGVRPSEQFKKQSQATPELPAFVFFAVFAKFGSDALRSQTTRGY